MSKTSKTKPITTKNSQRLSKKTIIILLGVLAGTIIAWQFFIRWLDPAYYAVKPVEDALIKAGGLKKCGTSDWGIGPDDLHPDHVATYEVPGTKGNTEKLLQDIAQRFSLTKEETDKSEHVDDYSNYSYGGGELHLTVYSKPSAQEGLRCMESSELTDDKTIILLDLNLSKR